MSMRIMALLPTAASILSGCHGGGETSAFQRRDSAGVQIVESYRPIWVGGEGWRVGSQPLLKIGVVEGDAAFQFDGVTGLARLKNGTVVVADGGSQEIRFFDASGALVAVAGGMGEGPGEFTFLSGLGPGPDGGVWAYDFMLRRITWLDALGGVERLTSLGPEPAILNAVGPLPDGTFLLKQLWGATQVAEAREAGLRRDPVAFVRFAPDGELVDTLGLFPGREVFLRDENGRGVMSTPPFARNSVGAPWGVGVAAGTQDTFELMEVAPGGEVTRIVRIPGWDLSLGPGDMDDYIEGRLETVPPEGRRGLRQELESMPVPSTRPAYGNILADEAGNLWVSAWAHDPGLPDGWTLLDSTGRWLGEVTLPPSFSPYAIGRDWILGVELDGMDVEFVVLYPLIKDSGDE